jgi:hypothetical protein
VRALAAHPRYRHSADTRHAAELVKSRFFRPYACPDRAAPSYWLVFSYPEVPEQVGRCVTREPFTRAASRDRPVAPP